MDQNNNFFFLVSFSACPVPFWLEMKPEWFFLIFCIFLLFFCHSLFRVGLEWIRMITFFFFGITLSRSYPVLAWKEAIMIFFNFLNFFAIFLEFPIPNRVKMDRNDNFFFLVWLSTCPVPLWLEMKPKWCFLIFWIFLLFFLEFPILGRVGMDQNDNFFFVWLSACPVPHFHLKWSHSDVF